MVVTALPDEKGVRKSGVCDVSLLCVRHIAVWERTGLCAGCSDMWRTYALLRDTLGPLH